MRSGPNAHAQRSAFEAINRQAQQCLSEIASIARLALQSMEAPSHAGHVDDLAQALAAIWARGRDTRDRLLCEAEEVDCPYVDEAWERRHAVQRASSPTEARQPFGRDVRPDHPLGQAIVSITGLAQGALFDIAAVARVASRSLETVEGAFGFEDLAGALQMIWSRAMDAQSTIHGKASEAGCVFLDEAERRRYDAQGAACRQGAHHG